MLFHWAQFRSRFDVQLEAAAVLMDHHAVVALRRFERDVAGAHVGAHSLGFTLKARRTLLALPSRPEFDSTFRLTRMKGKNCMDSVLTCGMVLLVFGGGQVAAVAKNCPETKAPGDMIISQNHLPRAAIPKSTHQYKNLLSILVFFGICVLANVSAPALAQEQLSPSALEELLKDVHPKRVVDLIKQRGINFDLTEDLRTRFKRTGAGSEVMRELELAAIRCRLGKCGEKPKSQEPSREQRSPAERHVPSAKTDSAKLTDTTSRTSEPASGIDTKQRSASAGEEKSSIGENPELGQQKVVTLPAQLQERADSVLRMENISIKDGEVSGELVNISQQSVFGVQFQVLYSWRWSNDFKPGGQDPGRADYFTIDREIRPGQRVPFNHKPSPPLAIRKDGSFDISVKVIGFSKIFR